jgi:hypothetical protein
MKQVHLHIIDDLASNGRRSARIELPTGETQALFFEHDEGALSTANGANPFLLAFFLRLMEVGAPVKIHGAVSERLLTNLEELQGAWNKWLPSRYHRFDVEVDGFVAPGMPSNGPKSAMTAFSGGVDAGFCVYQHKYGDLVWGKTDLQAALLVHGFDVPLDQPDTFQSTRSRAAAMLNGTGLEFKTVRTDFKQLKQHWEHAFGLAIASCLSLFEGTYAVGIVGSSSDYASLALPSGSNAVTDHLFSTGDLEIRHEGAGFTRTEKVGEILKHPPFIEHVRVCWAGEQMDRNCGHCEKCVRTLLNFAVFGVEQPACFSNGLSKELIRSIQLKTPQQRNHLVTILQEAEQRQVDEWWTRELKRRLSFMQNSRDAVKAAPHRVKAHAKWRLKKAIGRA